MHGISTGIGIGISSEDLVKRLLLVGGFGFGALHCGALLRICVAVIEALDCLA